MCVRGRGRRERAWRARLAFFLISLMGTLVGLLRTLAGAHPPDISLAPEAGAGPMGVSVFELFGLKTLALAARRARAITLALAETWITCELLARVFIRLIRV